MKGNNMEKINYLFSFELRKGMTLPDGKPITEPTHQYKSVVIRSDPKYSSDYVSKELKRFSETDVFSWVLPHVWSGFLFYDKIVSDEGVKEIYSKWDDKTDHILDFPEDGKFYDCFYESK